MSRSIRHVSQVRQGIEWGAKRLGDRHYGGTPNHQQKKFTARAERLRDRLATLRAVVE